MSKASGEAERRRRARARKAKATSPAVTVRPTVAEMEAVLVDCPDRDNHAVCPINGDKHDWYKPHPRPADHKYQCLACGHYDLDDYR